MLTVVVEVEVEVTMEVTVFVGDVISVEVVKAVVVVVEAGAVDLRKVVSQLLRGIVLSTLTLRLKLSW